MARLSPAASFSLCLSVRCVRLGCAMSLLPTLSRETLHVVREAGKRAGAGWKLHRGPSQVEPVAPDRRALDSRSSLCLQSVRETDHQCTRSPREATMTKIDKDRLRNDDEGAIDRF